MLKCHRFIGAHLRPLTLFMLPMLLSGCISFNSAESLSAPDFIAACEGTEAQCKKICGPAGIQTFYCKAAPREGMDYKCECKKLPQGI